MDEKWASTHFSCCQVICILSSEVRTIPMKTDFIAAITQVSSEKGVSKEVVIEAIEAALVSAYKRNFGDANQDVAVRLHRQTGDVRVFVSKRVIEEVADD